MGEAESVNESSIDAVWSREVCSEMTNTREEISFDKHQISLRLLGF